MLTEMRESSHRICLTTRLPLELHELVEAVAIEQETSINHLICEAPSARFGIYFPPLREPRTFR
jgi:hypothetical protein